MSNLKASIRAKSSASRLLFVVASLFTFACVAFPCQAQDDHEFRVWTTADGKHSVEAVFVDKNGSGVVLQRKDNDKRVTVSLQELSQSDLEYLWKTEVIQASEYMVLGQEKRAKKGEPKSPKTLEYSVVFTSGNRKAIVIDPAFRNEKDMRALGEELRKDSPKKKNVFVVIFDNARAANMHKKAIDTTLREKDEAFYDKHMIGTYNRVTDTGYHAYQITLKGLQGPSIDIDFAD